MKITVVVYVVLDKSLASYLFECLAGVFRLHGSDNAPFIDDPLGGGGPQAREGTL